MEDVSGDLLVRKTKKGGRGCEVSQGMRTQLSRRKGILISDLDSCKLDRHMDK